MGIIVCRIYRGKNGRGREKKIKKGNKERVKGDVVFSKVRKYILCIRFCSVGCKSKVFEKIVIKFIFI